MSSDFDAIRHVLSIARDRGFAEVVLESGDLKFKAALEKRDRPKPKAASIAQDPALESPKKVEVCSTLVGYFRAAEPPVAEGDTVSEGQVVGVIASLGDIPYAVESPTDGVVARVLVEPGQPVMYGQPIMEIEP